MILSAAEPEWPVREIVYTAIVGVVMLVALLEWALWILAFVYCLVQVYRKAEHWTIRVLAVVIGGLFVAMRALFLPVMLVTLPLPPLITQFWPPDLVVFLQWFAFWTFSLLLIVPSLVCIHELTLNRLQPASAIANVIPLLTEACAPKIAVIMPVYQESPEVLLAAITSIVRCKYPPGCLHIFLSFDSIAVNELYLLTIEALGVPLTARLDMPIHIDTVFHGVRITISRFPHAGKRACQNATYDLINRMYSEYAKHYDDILLLFVDSDCQLDPHALAGFAYDMYASPGNSRRTLAMTGLITSRTESPSLLTLVQDMEYVHGQLLERAVESGCGAVTCLPGALTILRFSAFRRMAPHYFAPPAVGSNGSGACDLFDYARTHLGEDRWLTHLLMIGAKRRGQLRLCTSARCKTEAVSSWTALVKQRRRWFLGFISNEAAMLTDCRLWCRYPLLLTVRFLHNTVRTTALLFFVLVLALATSSQTVEQLPMGFLAISLGLNWMLMLYFGAVLGRFKVWLYPVMFVVNPFFNWWYMVYAIFTSGQRTWGGPRADAGRADASILAVAAASASVHRAQLKKLAPEECHDDSRTASLVRPPDSLDGCFTMPEYADDVMVEMEGPLGHVEMLECMNSEDRRKYHMACEAAKDNEMRASSE